MPTTPKCGATRRRILDAAWDLSDARGAAVILGGVTLREVARAADLTPSAVSYHFPTMEVLSLAMVDHHLSSIPLLSVELVDQILDTAQDRARPAIDCVLRCCSPVALEERTQGAGRTGISTARVRPRSPRVPPRWADAGGRDRRQRRVRGSFYEGLQSGGLSRPCADAPLQVV